MSVTAFIEALNTTMEGIDPERKIYTHSNKELNENKDYSIHFQSAVSGGADKSGSSKYFLVYWDFDIILCNRQILTADDCRHHHQVRLIDEGINYIKALQSFRAKHWNTGSYLNIRQWYFQKQTMNVMISDEKNMEEARLTINYRIELEHTV